MVDDSDEGVNDRVIDGEVSEDVGSVSGWKWEGFFGGYCDECKCSFLSSFDVD